MKLSRLVLLFICSIFISLSSIAQTQSSSASMLYCESSPVRKLYWSEIHQPSNANCTICSPPFSSSEYDRRSPFSTNATYRHTSPSCNRYCFFLSFFGMKKLRQSSFSSSESLIFSFNFSNRRSNIVNGANVGLRY